MKYLLTLISTAVLSVGAFALEPERSLHDQACEELNADPNLQGGDCEAKQTEPNVQTEEAYTAVDCNGPEASDDAIHWIHIDGVYWCLQPTGGNEILTD